MADCVYSNYSCGLFSLIECVAVSVLWEFGESFLDRTHICDNYVHGFAHIVDAEVFT
jgi:hypothetical protein